MNNIEGGAKRFRVTRLFIGGTLKGLTHVGETSVKFTVGQEVETSWMGSGFRIVEVVEVGS